MKTTNTELAQRAFEILRCDMQYIHITDDELKENIEKAGDTILKCFIDQYDN